MDVRRLLVSAAVAAACLVFFTGAVFSQNKNAKPAAPAAQPGASVSHETPASVSSQEIVVAAPAGATVLHAESGASVSQYKIGIVDRRAVLQSYNKVTAERKKLESDVETENKEIDKLSADLQTAKETYDKQRDSLSSTEREEREMALQKQLMEYQTKVQTKQAEVDDRERRLMKRFFTDIDDAVQKMGDAENYHLIIDGSKGTSTLFYAPAIDISQKVIDYLNANSK